MSTLDITVNAIGIAYGLLLILGMVVRNKLTEALRVDALFIPNFSEGTRPLNLLVGLVVAGYGTYSLLAR